MENFKAEYGKFLHESDPSNEGQAINLICFDKEKGKRPYFSPQLIF